MARTVQKIRLSLLALLGASILTAGALDTGIRATAHRLLLFGGEKAIQSGLYTLGTDRQQLRVVSLPFRYDLPSDTTLSPSLYGHVGYGAARYTSGTTTPWLKLFALQLGGGVRWSPTDETDLRLDGAYQFTHFSATTPVNGHGYETAASLAYHPTIGEWHPYLNTSLRYTATAVDAGGSASTTRSLIGKLKIGVISPILARPFDLPMRLEWYGTALRLHGDMARVLGTRTLWNTGIKAYLKSPVLEQWISDTTLTAQIVRGEDFRGFRVGVGVKF